MRIILMIIIVMESVVIAADQRRSKNILVARSIAEVADTAAESIWRVTVVDSGGAEIGKTIHASRNVRQDLRQQHELLQGD